MNKRIEFDDDIVVVLNQSGKEIYKGPEDYEPMKNEDWRWNKEKKLYECSGYTKICIDLSDWA